MIVRRKHRLRAWLAGLVGSVLAVALVPAIARAVDTTPHLEAGGVALAGAYVSSPFAAEVVNGSAFVSVKFLLDNVFLGEDKTAPFSWTVTATAGAHALRARAEDAAGTRTTMDAAFTVGVAPTPTPSASATVSPSTPPSPSVPARLVTNGAPLDTAQVTSPFTAEVVDPGTVDEDVTFLLDNVYLGVDATAPYTRTITTTVGTHALKARWDSGGVRQTLTAAFRVVELSDWVPPETDYEEPGPALKNLSVSAGSRRDPVDGLYDWSKAGYGDGAALPTDDDVRAEDACQITAAELAADYGVHPDDGADDTGALQAAVDAIKSGCSPDGGYTSMSRILLPAGTLNISHELSLDADYLILRGAGSGAGGTRLVYAPNADTRYDTLTADGSRWDQDAMTSGDAGGGWLWPGRGLFRVQSRAVAEKYATAYAAAPENRKDLFEGTVNDHWVSGLAVRAQDDDPGFAARQGDTVVQLAAAASFANVKVGGLVNVMAANSRKFYEQMQALPTDYDLQNLHMRQQVFTVTEADPVAQTVTLDKPLEYDLPVDSTSDGSAVIDGKIYASKVTPLVDPVVGVGIEDLAFTQEMNLDRAQAQYNYGNLDPAGAMHGIVFKWAADSWVKGVRAEMTGSHPIVTEVASHLSIVDNELDGSWNKGKGGNGYFRGSRVWDSLYAGNKSRSLRHFTFQWSAAGNVVIGNSFDSDLNLHGGYERNNLFELNEVSVPYAHRSGNCGMNCGDEGGSDADDSNWYPIYWSAGRTAVKWAGSSGPNNVFFNNHMRKQLGSGTVPYTDYAQYNEQSRVYQFGVDAAGGFRHLAQGGVAIDNWAHGETLDYTAGDGVVATRTDTGSSIFLDSVALGGYGGSSGQPPA